MDTYLLSFQSKDWFCVLALLICLSVSGTAQTVSTVAGNGVGGFSGDGGPATSARLSKPVGIAFDGAGNMYIADQFNGRIRKVSTSGVISTVAGGSGCTGLGDGGPATSACLAIPYDVAVDGAGNLYIADQNNHCVSAR